MNFFLENYQVTHVDKLSQIFQKFLEFEIKEVSAKKN